MPALPNCSCGPEPIAACATASFSVQPAFVTNICAILTIQKANYTLSDLFFLMTVLVFAYIAGLIFKFTMVHARSRDASSEEAKMPRHVGVLVSIERPWAKAAGNLEFNQEPDQICFYQLHDRMMRSFVTYIQPQTNGIAHILAILPPRKL